MVDRPCPKLARQLLPLIPIYTEANARTSAVNDRPKTETRVFEDTMIYHGST